MKLYLAGGMSYRELLFGGAIMKLFLAGDVPWRELIYSKAIINCPTAEENQEGNSMNIMLAGGESRADKLGEQRKKYKPYILESFLQTTEKSVKYLPYYGDYMLDSGAFSMLMGNAKKVDLKTYVDSYIAYVQKYI